MTNKRRKDCEQCGEGLACVICGAGVYENSVPKSIAPEDMEDGKRYRIIFEGTAGITEWGDRPLKHIGFCINEIGYWLNPEEISGAIRIEEIQ